MGEDMRQRMHLPATLLIRCSRTYDVGESRHARGFSVFTALALGRFVNIAYHFIF